VAWVALELLHTHFSMRLNGRMASRNSSDKDQEHKMSLSGIRVVRRVDREHQMVGGRSEEVGMDVFDKSKRGEVANGGGRLP
jgi:hypothetical protein